MILAATKSLLSEQQGCMKTKSIYTEIMYNLFPGKNVSPLFFSWLSLSSTLKRGTEKGDCVSFLLMINE